MKMLVLELLKSGIDFACSPELNTVSMLERNMNDRIVAIIGIHGAICKATILEGGKNKRFDITFMGGTENV